MTAPRRAGRPTPADRVRAPAAPAPGVAGARRGERPPLVHHLAGRPRDGLGDRSALAGLRVLLPATRVEQRPGSVAGRPASLRVGAAVGVARRAHLLVGGGLVIGNPAWTRRLHQAAALGRPRPLLMVGAGVDDRLRTAGGATGEARRWIDLLRRFDAVTVRGPRSAEVLADLGVPSLVVGDPALALVADRPARLDSGCIAIAPGLRPEGPGHDEAAAARELARAAAALVRDGLEVRLLVTAEQDRREVTACAAHVRLTTGPVEVVDAFEPDDFLAAVSACAVMVGQRLPALVLAAVAGVPVVAVGDAPDIEDFMRSIGRDDRRVEAEGFDADGLVDTVQAVLIAARFEAHDQSGAVERLRHALHREARRLEPLLRP